MRGLGCHCVSCSTMVEEHEEMKKEADFCAKLWHELGEFLKKEGL